MVNLKLVKYLQRLTGMRPGQHFFRRKNCAKIHVTKISSRTKNLIP